MMRELSGKDKFMLSFVTVHLTSITLSGITWILTDLLTGIISYLIYIHITAALVYLGYDKYQINLEKIVSKI